MSVVGATIRALRERYLLTQDELGALIGVSENTIGNWERGVHAPKPRQLRALSEVFVVSPADLLAGGEPPPLSDAEERQARKAIRDALRSLGRL